jgi:hypothetical protein
MRPGPRWTTALPLALGLVAAAAVADRDAVRAAPAEPATARWQLRRPVATLLLFGRNAGKMKPCGCSQPQLGGVERAARAKELLTRRADGALAAVSLGGIVPPLGGSQPQNEQNALKAQFYRAVLRVEGYAALALGLNDLYVRDLVVGFGGEGSSAIDRPLLPVNVKPSAVSGADLSAAGVPWAEFALRQIRVRVLSVVDEARGEDLKSAGIADYVSAPATVLQGLQPNADVVWVIAVDGDAGTLDAVRAAARTLGPCVLVDMNSLAHDAPRERVPLGSDPLVVSFDEKGKGLGVLDFDPGPDGKGWLASYHPQPLGPDFDEGVSDARAAVSDLFAIYRRQVREEGFLKREVRRKEEPGAATYVGSAACARCHSGVYEEWLRTPHAHALRTLKNHDYAWDPECLTCHVVGVTRESGRGWSWWGSGFADPSRTPHLGGVGCESCHGPGSRHVAEPWQKEPFQPGGPNRRHPGREGCMTCHDIENSVGFYEQYAARLEKVDHRYVPKDRRTHEPGAR